MITVDFIKKVLAIEINFDHEFSHFGMSNTDLPNSLSYIDDSRFISEANLNHNITGIITTREIADQLNNKQIIMSDEPRYDFYNLMNIYNKQNYKRVQSVIHYTSNIHKTAFINEYNVKIGANTIIEPNVTILADVEIGENCIIRAGSVLGSEGFEYKKTSKGLIPVFHSGQVIIGHNVVIGAVNTIAKGWSYKNTIIKDNVVIDNLVHVAHGVIIGDSSIITAGVVIAGAVVIGNNVYIGPNATVSHRINIGDCAYITLGAVVVKDVAVNQKVTGNFAIPHDKFILNLKSLVKSEIVN